MIETLDRTKGGKMTDDEVREVVALIKYRCTGAHLPSKSYRDVNWAKDIWPLINRLRREFSRRQDWTIKEYGLYRLHPGQCSGGRFYSSPFNRKTQALVGLHLYDHPTYFNTGRWKVALACTVGDHWWDQGADGFPLLIAGRFKVPVPPSNHPKLVELLARAAKVGMKVTFPDFPAWCMPDGYVLTVYEDA